MNRSEFERLRDLPDKVITEDVKLVRRKALDPVLVSTDLVVENSLGLDVRMVVKLNQETAEKTIVVIIRGVGPVCRLDLDGHEHRSAGRCHKHSLGTPRCPDQNLPEGVVTMTELSGLSLEEMFSRFCTMARIEVRGRFHAPETVGGGRP